MDVTVSQGLTGFKKQEENIIIDRSNFINLRHELLFIVLSVLLLVGIGLLPKSTPTTATPQHM